MSPSQRFGIVNQEKIRVSVFGKEGDHGGSGRGVTDQACGGMGGVCGDGGVQENGGASCFIKLIVHQIGCLIKLVILIKLVG
jgi:hypothetical protein